MTSSRSRRRRRLFVAPLAAVALLLLSSREVRAGASARLTYVRGPGAEKCPGEQAIRAAVSTRLGYDPFFPWAHDTLFVEVTRGGGAFHVEIKMVDQDNLQRGARSLAVKGSDCAAVVDAMALTISLTIDPSSIAGPTAPPPPPPPEPPAPPPPAPDPAPEPPRDAPAPPPPPPEAVQAHLGVTAASALGSSPGLAAGGAAFVGVRWRALSLDVEARGDLPATGAGNTAGVRVQSWLLAGSVVPCLHLGVGYACVVASGGSLTATAVQGVTSPQTSGGLWLAVGPRLGVELPLSDSFALRGYGEILVTPVKTELDLGSRPPTQQVYTFSPVSGGVGIGVAWRFL
ncbi:MAG TPA: hypothetical protein VIF15_01935 [Polyangiaceae bacterium]|jgi:hypothetical protein